MTLAQVEDAQAKNVAVRDRLETMHGTVKDGNQPTQAQREALRAESESLQAAIDAMLS